jgi:uncharacterized protein (DUF488 family)
MLYYRRLIMLAILKAFGGSMSAKYLQKLLFLFDRIRQRDDTIYDFVPFKYGCYSFQAHQDVLTLNKYGYISLKEDNSLLITLIPGKKIEKDIDIFDATCISDLKDKYANMDEKALIKYTYINYPFYAINSVMAKEILNDDELKKVESQKRTHKESMLFTIGYEGISLENYIKKLIVNDIHMLCDVRKNAYSQKFGFSKKNLQEACEGVDIKYMHIPQLGIESEYRQELKTQADYDALFQVYEKTTLQDNWDYLLHVRDIIEKYNRVALTCFEHDPKQCHRGRVAKYLMQLPDIKYDLKHIQ